MSAHNPFEAPQVPLGESVLSPSAALAIRNAHRYNEAHLQSAGSLWGLLALFAAAVVINTLIAGGLLVISIPDEVSVPSRALMLALPITVASGLVSYGLQTFKPWSPWPATIAAVIALPVLGIGTLLGLYTLYAVWSAKGRRVLQADYALVLLQAPVLPPLLPKRRIFLALLVFAGVLLAGYLSGQLRFF